MKAFLFTAALLATFCHSLGAQNNVAGTVKDAAGKPMEFVTVMLLNAADSSLVRGAFSDVQGHYTFENIPAGAFLAAFDFLGYARAYSESVVLDEKNSPVTLAPVVLLENSTQLGAVNVVARRPFLEQKIDRTVVNVANSITNAGGTALQVLQRSPGVQVNALTKTISLSGKQGVIVMINNKISRIPAEALVDMLAGMNSDNIDRIELIHTPPANFDAEGNAGIIHIVLKSSGDVGLYGGYSTKAGYGSGPKYGFGGYFNRRKNQINLFGSYDLDFNLNPQVFTNYRRVLLNNDVLETDIVSDRPYTPTTTQNARVGADFQVSKKTIIGVLGTFFDRNWYMEAENYVQYLKNSSVDSLIRMPNEETNHSRSLGGNINLAQQFSDNQSLNLDADFVQYNIENPSYYNIQNLDVNGVLSSQNERRIDKDTPVRVAVGKADYTLGLNKKTQLEMGLKLTSLRFNNDVQVDFRSAPADWQTDYLYTSSSRLRETLMAAYGSFSSKLGKKTDFKAGLRYEHTNTRLDSGAQVIIVDRNYGSFFPSLFLSHQISEKQSVNGSYSRRITRPSIRQLAPWLIFADPTTLEGGNPALQPSFTDAINVGYAFKSYRIGVSYSIEKDPISYVPSVDKVKNRQFNFRDNLGQLNSWFVNLYLPFQPVSWWNLTGNCYWTASQLDFTLEGKALQINNSSYGFNVSNTITLPRQFTLEVTGEYNSPSYWGLGYWRATNDVNMGIEKNFGQKWGKLRFNVNDLFKGTSWYATTDQTEIGLYVKSSYQIAERVFMLSWTNTFGNQKLKSERKRQTASAEEMRRI
jgi:outer membrane receptor protein involved in Fe transport